MRRGAFTFTRPRVLSMAAVVLVAVLGSLLPYLTLTYQDYSSTLVTSTRALWPGADLLRSVNIVYLPSYATVGGDALQRGVDVMTLGATAQQIGVVVAVVTVVGLAMDEINKFFWWPLHLAGWLLALGGPILLVGVALFRAAQVDVVPLVGWIPLVADGVFVLVLTFRAHSRIDSYRGL